MLPGAGAGSTGATVNVCQSSDVRDSIVWPQPPERISGPRLNKTASCRKKREIDIIISHRGLWPGVGLDQVMQKVIHPQ